MKMVNRAILRGEKLDDDCFPRGRAVGKIWNDSTFDKERNLLGVVFRTEQEAIDYLPTWEKRLEGEEM